MSGNTFGRLFRVTTFGESHGPALGAIIDGCPPGLALSPADLASDLERRRPGRNRLMSARAEPDAVAILSGVSDGLTTGTPIALQIRNEDARPKAYADFATVFRPSHADFTYHAKFAHRTRSGGGRASARETAARVAAGAVARKLLATTWGIEIVAWVSEVSDITSDVDETTVHGAAVQAHAVQCPDEVAAERMEACIEAARKAGDTVGGVITCVARGVPAGWGDPVFDKLEACLGMALLSIPACKGFESGSGFAGARTRGSAHNDAFFLENGMFQTRTNHSGGIQGGISNGMPIVVRAAFKPVATHFHPQESVDEGGQAVTFTARGRHDPCVLPRAVVIVEAMVALTLCDAWLRDRAQCGERAPR